MPIFSDSDCSVEKRALELSREIVANELTSIDRMHTRTLTYISRYTAVIVAGFGLLGWIGYEKLQGIVLDATLEKVQEQTLQRVDSQVDQDLKRMDVQGLITKKIADFASSDMRSVMSTEVEHGPVHDEIRRIALSVATGARGPAAQPTSANVSTPTVGRTVTDDQRKKFFGAVNERHLLAPSLGPGQTEDRNTEYYRHLLVLVLPGDAEALNYAQQIRSLLASIGWDADVAPDPSVANIANHRFAVGLHAVVNSNAPYTNSSTRRSNEASKNIIPCFIIAGLPLQAGDPPEGMKRDFSTFLAVGAQR